MQKYSYLLCLVCCFLIPGAYADHQSDMKDFELRNQSIQALFSAFRSSAISINQHSRIAPVETKIKQDIQQARQLYSEHQASAGQAILKQSYDMVKNAIIELRDGSTVTNTRDGDQYEIRATEPPAKRDHDTLNDSIDALLVAYQRAADEKGEQARAQVLQGNIKLIRSRAESLYQQDNPQGHELLQGAYTLIKEALAAMRQGDTLVQSLNFANALEEYQYYQNKVGSQMTALKILLSVNQGSSADSNLDRILTSSASLVEQASDLAAQDQYTDANRMMDKAFTRLQSGLMMSLSSR